MLRWRKDKPAAEADTLETLKAQSRAHEKTTGHHEKVDDCGAGALLVIQERGEPRLLGRGTQTTPAQHLRAAQVRWRLAHA